MSEKLSVHETRYRIDNPEKRRDVLIILNIQPRRSYVEWVEMLYQRRLKKLDPPQRGTNPWIK